MARRRLRDVLFPKEDWWQGAAMLLGGIIGYSYHKIKFHFATVAFSSIGTVSEDVLKGASRIAADLDTLGLFFLVISPLIAFPLLLIGRYATGAERIQKVYLFLGLLLAGFIALAFIGFRFRSIPTLNYVAVENKAANLVASRAETLIDAIERYHTDQGSYPDKIEDLIPQYVEEIPSTGIAVWPVYAYSTQQTHYRMPFDKYQLLVGIRYAPFHRKDFIYWPDGNYPETHSDFIRRIGDWAYIRHSSS